MRPSNELFVRVCPGCGELYHTGKAHYFACSMRCVHRLQEQNRPNALLKEGLFQSEMAALERLPPDLVQGMSRPI